MAKKVGTATPDVCLLRAGDEAKLLSRFPQYIFIKLWQMAAEVTASTPSSFQLKGVRESDTSITKARLIQTESRMKEERELEKLLS